MQVPMTGKDLYEEIKQALSYFGLSFHEMDQVIVTINTTGPEPEIVFSYGTRHIAIKPHY